MPATLTFDKYNRVIQVDKPQLSVSIQDLINQIRDYEDELDYMDYPKICDAFGKQSLGGGTFVGITLVLLNNWRLAFEGRTEAEYIANGSQYFICTVSGGNLVATNDYSNNPIKATSYVQVVIAQSSSPTIATPASDYSLLYLIESLRGRHASIGNVYYWDPTSGSNSNDGTTPSAAKATFAAAQALCSSGNNDVIFALSTDSSGITTVTETISITVPTLKLRGPGYPFQFVPSSAGSPTINISADSVELSGFYVSTAAGGTDNGITITGDNALIKDVWVKSVTGDGINISSSTRSRIDTCAIEDATSEGVAVGASTNKLTIKQCIISGSGSDGIALSGASITDNIVENNIVYNNTGYGVNVGSGVTRTGVRLHNTFSGNAGDTQTTGSVETFIDSGGAVTASDITNIVDAVWDELITDHATANTTGRTLSDAKKRATLASLK